MGNNLDFVSNMFYCFGIFSRVHLWWLFWIVGWRKCGEDVKLELAHP